MYNVTKNKQTTHINMASQSHAKALKSLLFFLSNILTPTELDNFKNVSQRLQSVRMFILK